MDNRNIIVIGASAGGFNAIQGLIKELPPDFNASIFIVWHMAPDVTGILPRVINKQQTMPAFHPKDREPIAAGRVYVAPPDHHMIIDKNEIRITRGPKENRFRPAIDPLFRSAAYHYGPRVVGIILSGALDDGSAGLWAIKQFGGVAIVQDPDEAEVSAMPENAMRAVAVDHKLKISAMPTVLTQLIKEEVPVMKDSPSLLKKTETEIKVAMEDRGLENNVFGMGELTPYTCPECHGVLAKLVEGERMRFRCHTGHAFSFDSLLVTVTERVEESLWSAIRNVQESVILLNHMGDHLAEQRQSKLAALYFKKATDAEARIELLRGAVFSHERLNGDNMAMEAEENGSQ
jgi:two-component system chemotaxis response regulator CheB